MRSRFCALLLLGCALPAWAAETPAVTPPAPDATSLRAAENAFAASVRERDRERFAKAIADDAIFVSGNEVLRGRAAIVAAWAGRFAPDAAPMDWHPEVAEVQDGGALGLTRGPWTIAAKDRDGKPAPRSGTFNSVWRREADGTWKVVFDAGCPPCPCASKP